MLGKILSPYKTPPFTLPFNISTLLFLLAMGGMNNVDMAPVRPPELPSYESEPVASLTATAFFAGSIRGKIFCYILEGQDFRSGKQCIIYLVCFADAIIIC